MWAASQAGSTLTQIDDGNVSAVGKETPVTADGGPPRTWGAKLALTVMPQGRVSSTGSHPGASSPQSVQSAASRASSAHSWDPGRPCSVPGQEGVKDQPSTAAHGVGGTGSRP